MWKYFDPALIDKIFKVEDLTYAILRDGTTCFVRIDTAKTGEPNLSFVPVAFTIWVEKDNG